MASLILPMGEPLIQTFNEYGNLFSIVHHENNVNYKKLIVQYFTNLYCVPEEYSKYKNIFSFYPERHAQLMRECPLLQSQVYFRREVMNQEESVVSKLTRFIDQGYYVTSYVDLYYLPCSESYRKRHLNHKIMIFGYETKKNILLVIDTFRSFKYAPSEISYREFEQAFYSFDEADNRREDIIVATRFRDQEIELDINKLKKSLQDFYLIDECIPYVSGYHVYDVLEKGIVSDQYLHPQSIKILCEHIEFTLVRAKLLQELNIIHLSEKEWEQLNELVKQSTNVRNLYLKCIVLYEIRADQEFKNHVMKNIEQMKEKHIEVIQRLVKNMII